MRLIWIVLLDALGVITGVVILGTVLVVIWQFISNIILKRRWKNGKAKDLTGGRRPNNRRATKTSNRFESSGHNQSGEVGSEFGSQNNSSINRQEPSTHGTGIDRVKRLFDQRRAGQ